MDSRDLSQTLLTTAEAWTVKLRSAIAPQELTSTFGALGWTRTSIGRSRNPLTVQLVHERVKQLCNFLPQSGDLFILDDPACAAPAHDGFADRRVPVSPRVNIGSLSRFPAADINVGQRGVI